MWPVSLWSPWRCLTCVQYFFFNFCTTLNPAISAPQMNFGVNRKRSTISNSSKILKKNRFSADYTLTLTFLVHSMLQVRFKFLAIKIPWLRIRVRRTYSYWPINCGLEGRVKKCVRRTLTSIHPIYCFSDVAYLTYARMNHSEWLLVWIISKRKKLWNLYRQFDEG